jgi:hypothetical protein
MIHQPVLITGNRGYMAALVKEGLHQSSYIGDECVATATPKESLEKEDWDALLSTGAACSRAPRLPLEIAPRLPPGRSSRAAAGSSSRDSTAPPSGPTRTVQRPSADQPIVVLDQMPPVALLPLAACCRASNRRHYRAGDVWKYSIFSSETLPPLQL